MDSMKMLLFRMISKTKYQKVVLKTKNWKMYRYVLEFYKFL